LTEGGLLSAHYAPNLAKLARRSALFHSVYASFPGTTRSLVSLHTGGRQATQGGIGEYEHRYEGQILARSMKALSYETALFPSQRLDVEPCDVFLRQGDYDTFQDFDQDFASNLPENSIHSWGAREEYTVRLMDRWLEGRKKPLYLEYMDVPLIIPMALRPATVGRRPAATLKLNT